MSWTFEKIYASDGTELSTAGLATTNAGAAALVYDDRYLWVGGGDRVNVYEFWGAASDDEPAFEELDDLTLPDYDAGPKKKLRLVTSFQLASTSAKRTTRLPSLAEAGATAYALSDGSGETGYYKQTTGLTLGTPNIAFGDRLGSSVFFASTGGATPAGSITALYEFDVETQALVRRIPTTVTVGGTTYGMNSNLAAAGGRLWMVGSYFADDYVQQLYSMDPFASTALSATDTHGRPQAARAWLADGYNGGLYKTDYNDVSVTRYDSTTGAYVTQVRTNAFPTRVFVGSDRRIWACSFAGMVTLIDWDDNQAHNDYGTLTSCLGWATDPSDGTKAWFITVGGDGNDDDEDDGSVVRYDLNDKSRLENSGSTKDWQFSSDRLPAAPTALLVTPATTYTSGAGADRAVKPYVFLLTAGAPGALRAFRLDRPLRREAYAEMRGQAAVAGGARLYFGETG